MYDNRILDFIARKYDTSMESIQQEYAEMKNKEILSQYHIWYQKNRGYYITWLLDEEGRRIKQAKRKSRRWESNPRFQLGRLMFYHWTTPAYVNAQSRNRIRRFTQVIPQNVRWTFWAGSYCIFKCSEPESNQRHEDFQSSALPTELSERIFTLQKLLYHTILNYQAFFHLFSSAYF